MIRGEIYRVREPEALRGHKPGYYVVVSRNFIATTEEIATAICAPVYSNWRNLETEVAISEADGVDHPSSIRCDFLVLLRKDRLNHLVGSLAARKLEELDRALSVALAPSLSAVAFSAFGLGIVEELRFSGTERIAVDLSDRQLTLERLQLGDARLDGMTTPTALLASPDLNAPGRE